MTLNSALKQMFSESVPHHFLDSGSAYGYNYEENQKRNFDDEPDVFISEYEGKLDGIFINSFKFLEENLIDFAENLTIQFWNEIDENDQEVSDEDIIKKLGGEICYERENTYNFDTLLDSIFIYCHFEIEGNMYVMLRLHQGSDVRGGYTAPYIFKCEDYIFNHRIILSCTKNIFENHSNTEELPIKTETKEVYHDIIVENDSEMYNDDGEKVNSDISVINNKIICPICGSTMTAHF